MFKLAMIHGIPNAGSTCYRNSVMQILIHVPIKTDNTDFPNIVRAYKSGNMHASDLDSLVRETVFADPDQQHDAHEFFLHVLDRLGDPSEFCIRGYRKLINPFTGEKKKFPFSETILSLPLSSSLQCALHQFFQPEIIEGYRWDDRRLSVRSRQVITRWPPYLMVHFQRYNNSMCKIDRDIHVPTSWRIVQDHGSGTNISCYALKGAVFHLGNKLNCGHYVSILRKDSDTVYFCNDEKVTPIRTSSLERILPKAYLLLFVREKKGRLSTKKV